MISPYATRVPAHGDRSRRGSRVQFLQRGWHFIAANDELVELDRAVGFDRDRQYPLVDVRTLRRLGQLHRHAGERRQEEHEDDQQNETDVDERSDVDVGSEGLVWQPHTGTSNELRACEASWCVGHEEDCGETVE